MYHFIINPASSSGKGLRIWNRVEVILKEEKIRYKAHILQNAEEVTKLVGKLTDTGLSQTESISLHNVDLVAESQEVQECHLVVLGGDGTLNAVLNGIRSFEHTLLSCIRTGSGNDFARNMGIDKDIRQALYGILYHKEEIVLDYGEITYQLDGGMAEHGQLPQTRRFIISSGIGYDADICEEVSRSRLKKTLNKIHLGKLVYVAIGVKQIFTRKVTGSVVYMDETKAVSVPDLFFVAGMIHEREGGGIPFCPHADPADGFLDICLVRNMPKWKLLIAVVLVYAKKHYIFQNITEHRCKKIKIKTEKPQWFHMDGETPCRAAEVTWECKQGLRFLL